MVVVLNTVSEYFLLCTMFVLLNVPLCDLLKKSFESNTNHCLFSLRNVSWLLMFILSSTIKVFMKFKITKEGW